MKKKIEYKKIVDKYFDLIKKNKVNEAIFLQDTAGFFYSKIKGEMLKELNFLETKKKLSTKDLDDILKVLNNLVNKFKKLQKIKK